MALTEVSPEELRIRIEPEEDVLPAVLALGLPPGETPPVLDEDEPKPVELTLRVRYTADYPDEPPQMQIYVIRDTKGVLGPETEEDQQVPEEGDDEPETTRESLTELLQDLEAVAQESLGMAMVFTLASHLRESLTAYIQKKIDQLEAEESARRDAEIEVSETLDSIPASFLNRTN